MRVLCFVLILHAVAAKLEFGNSYLKNSKLCHQWNCLNEKLGLPDALPPKEQYAAVLSSLLPGSWQAAVAPALGVCYGARPRQYTGTCPGQALMQCAVEQLMQNCPASNLNKDDACAPLSSLAGFKYLFSQSRYNNLAKNLPKERRPSWFLTNYFNNKCCELPQLFNSSLLAECGVESVIHYYVHSPLPPRSTPLHLHQTPTTAKNVGEGTLKVVPLPKTPAPVAASAGKGDVLKIVDISKIVPEVSLDPLSCCDISGFIEPSWREECGFHLSWGGAQRLQVQDQGLVRTTTSTPAPTTTTTITSTRSMKHNDVKIIPQSCEIENCIFKQLNIVTTEGTVDKDAFAKLLDNMTSEYPAWSKAKARALTSCLSRPLSQYDGDCEINRLLTCTFDVLSENCPHAKKADPCKHSNVLREDISCQISASKYRPKNRRTFCGIPSLVPAGAVSSCGGKPAMRMEYVPEAPTPAPHTRRVWLRPKTALCKETSESTQCLMRKMGVLNKYGFLDYFKTKDRIRQFSQGRVEWGAHGDVYLAAFLNTPAFYREHCNSPQKFLNVIDSMLMTCPVSRRKFTPQCNTLFGQIVNSTPFVQQNITKERLDQILKYVQKVLSSKPRQINPGQKLLHSKLSYQTPELQETNPKNTIQESKPNPYAFGLLNSKDAPPVKMTKIKPAVMYKKPLVLLPVYRQLSNGSPGKMNFALKRYSDGAFRGAPFLSPPKNSNSTRIALP